MCAWLKSHQSLSEHPKKDHLAELLFNGTTPNDVADFAAIGMLLRLWWWALDYAQDGDLARFTDRQVAKGCGWQGDPKHLVQALTAAGFLDADRRIHDWDEYVGSLLAQRERDKERVRNWRKSAAEKPVTRNERGRKKERESKEAHGRADKSASAPALYCDDDGATIQPDGHCPVCQKVVTA